MTVLLLMVLAAGPRCGVERWPVKTLTDGEAGQVSFTPLEVTVEELRAAEAPRYDDRNGRAAEEKRVYRVEAEVVGFKQEADRDFHVVVRGATGATMVVEVVDPGCAAGSLVLLSIERAREDFLVLVGTKPGPRMVRPKEPIPVVIEGVGFFDRIHGQAGVAPNGAELHPVLKIERRP